MATNLDVSMGAPLFGVNAQHQQSVGFWGSLHMMLFRNTKVFGSTSKVVPLKLLLVSKSLSWHKNKTDIYVY